jgi:phosphomannomutase
MKNLQDLKDRLAGQPGHLGIATDGDADRFGVLDPEGNFVALHELLALFFRYLWDVRGWRGQVVRSTSMADSVDIPAAKRAAAVTEVPVGFKNITEAMISQPTIIGAEESGGFGYGVHIPERDGLLSSLLLIEMLGHYGAGLPGLLDELRKETGERAYDRIDFYHPAEQLQKRMAEIKKDLPDRIGTCKIRSVDEKDGIKFHFENNAWMLIRLSATEPMARIYVTAENSAAVQALLAAGRRMMGD